MRDRAGWKKKQNKAAAKREVRAAQNRHGSTQREIPTTSGQQDVPAKHKPFHASETGKKFPSLAARTFFVVSLVVAVLRAVQIIPLSYPWTVFLTYCLIILSGVEVVREPLPRALKWIAMFIVLAAAVWFTVIGPVSKAPLEVTAYVPPGEYSSGAVVGGISWNPHFTDLRIAITNPSSNNYRDFNANLVPDRWVHDAVILEGSGCTLSSIGGKSIDVAEGPIKTSTKHRFTGIRNGSSIEPYDNAGNVFNHFAFGNGYRLQCPNLSARSTINLLFSLVQIKSGILEQPPLGDDRGRFGISVSAFKGSTSAFDLLSDKPSTNLVQATETYSEGIKPYSRYQNVTVKTY